jgi:aspartate kinase
VKKAAMQVYKFGGSVLKDAAGVRAAVEQVKDAGTALVVVVSAFGKTTRALEEIAGAAWSGEKGTGEKSGRLREHHLHILRQLAGGGEAEEQVKDLFNLLAGSLEQPLPQDAGRWYDEIVSYGERLSAVIVGEALRQAGVAAEMIDIRQVIVTDDRHRQARVIMEPTRERVRKAFDRKHGIYITQGYIAATAEGVPTTLGREGSDYTAALLGSILGAEKVVLWKDVPGVMNADPATESDAVHLPGISYQEAAEMAFYGARVIHPMTIKPLENSHIPLVVRGLFTPENEGTLIWDLEEMIRHAPVFIRKERQILLSVFPRDYSFILNRHLEDLSGLFKTWRFNISLIQISAISVSFCIDDPEEGFMERVEELQKTYEVYFNREVELWTFRHYREVLVKKKLKNCVTLVEQRTRLTAQYVIKRV